MPISSELDYPNTVSLPNVSSVWPDKERVLNPVLRDKKQLMKSAKESHVERVFFFRWRTPSVPSAIYTQLLKTLSLPLPLSPVCLVFSRHFIVFFLQLVQSHLTLHHGHLTEQDQDCQEEDEEVHSSPKWPVPPCQGMDYWYIRFGTPCLKKCPWVPGAS